jgi:undecaprenyl pyrophosphate phosphatase UppP
MLAIPVIGGAGLLQILDMLDAGTTVRRPRLAIGFVVSMLVGLGGWQRSRAGSATAG